MEGGLFTKRRVIATTFKNVGFRFHGNLSVSLKILDKILKNRSQYIDTINGTIQLDEIMKKRSPWRSALSDSTTILYCYIKLNQKIDDIKNMYLSYGKTDFTKLRSFAPELYSP